MVPQPRIPGDRAIRAPDRIDELKHVPEARRVFVLFVRAQRCQGAPVRASGKTKAIWAFAGTVGGGGVPKVESKAFAALPED